MATAYAQNVGAVVRAYDPKTKAYTLYAYSCTFRERPRTNGDTYHFVRIIGICYAVRAPHFCNAHPCAQCF